MKYLFLVSITFFFFALTYSSAPKEFTTNDFTLILVIVLLALLVEASVGWFLRNIRTAQSIALAVFGFLNIATVHLVFNEQYIGLSLPLVLLSVMIGVFILQAMMSASEEYKPVGAGLSGLAFVATSIILFGSAFEKNHEGFGEDLAPVGLTSAKNVKMVSFTRKPNIYFIGYDSIVPEIIAENLLGVPPLAYHEVLEANTRRIPNLFADRTPTRRSLNTLLSFERRYTIQTQGKGVWYGFFSGKTASPMFEIFKQNGYETNTLFQNNYFGESGPLVDNYIVNSETGVCDFIDKRLRRYSFFGYCSVDRALAASPVLALLGLAAGPIDDPHDFLLHNLRQGLKRDKPQIFVAHIYSPGHTDKAFDHRKPGMLENFAKDYTERSNKAASYMEELFAFLREEDPSALVYVFGDHGMWLSRKANIDTETNFYVTDRHAITGGFWPADGCANELDAAEKLDFRTNSIMAQVLVACLADGEYPVIDFNLNEYELTLKSNLVSKDYRDYSYD